MTDPSYPVDASSEAQRVCCDAYDAARRDELRARIVVPDNLTSHAEVRALVATLPYVVRDELGRLIHDAFGDDYDDSDYHRVLESLRDAVVSRYEELDRYVETHSRRTS